jgi:hypothetical protein
MTRTLFTTLALASALAGAAQAQYTATYFPSPSGLPKTSEQGQSGTNDCGTGSSQTSQCQNFYLNNINDWCVWGPPNGGTVSDNERVEVSWCTQPGRGTRLIPEGTITGAHFVKTPSYVQITGKGDFTKIGITAGDEGGELDPHGADGNGNPIGGLVFHNGQQMHEWFSFISATDFCTRACYDGDRATSLCRHTYEELGCGFNAPGNYDSGVFESCQGNDAQDIMYGYPGLSTFQQTDTSYGVQVPSPHPAPASYNCKSQATIVQSSVQYAVSTASSSSTTSSSSTSSSTTSSQTPTSTTVVFVTAPVSTASVVVANSKSTSSQSEINAAPVTGSGFMVSAGLAALAGLAFML